MKNISQNVPTLHLKQNIEMITRNFEINVLVFKYLSHDLEIRFCNEKLLRLHDFICTFKVYANFL